MLNCIFVIIFLVIVFGGLFIVLIVIMDGIKVFGGEL